MPYISVNGTRLYDEDTGGAGEPVVFSHGLLWSLRMFDAQVEALRGRYRCFAYDHRGQGRSEAPGTGTITIETAYEDAVALIEELGLGPVHFVGLSMGGFVGMRLAARRPDLVRTLALMETSAEPEPEANVSRYRLLSRISRIFGLRVVASPVMRVMFGESFLTDPARKAERALWRKRLIENPPTIQRALAGVIERRAVVDELSRIRCPTLVLVGEEDVATVPAKAERMHALIPGSRLVRLPRGGHTSSVEEPTLVNEALVSFLAPAGGASREA